MNFSPSGGRRKQDSGRLSRGVGVVGRGPDVERRSRERRARGEDRGGQLDPVAPAGEVGDRVDIGGATELVPNRNTSDGLR